MTNPISKITIGTRGSDLALQQSNFVKEKLLALYPDIVVELKVITTKGDKNSAPIPLDEVGKGWFTKEIEQSLLNGSIDLAVHSLKDMPEILPGGLIIGAYPAREDARDVLVSKNGLELASLLDGAIIGTDSIRRKVQLLALRPDLQVKSIRGNVPTRLQKLHDESYDALVLAAAGLKRLHLEQRITQYFEPTEMIPAPGQGVLAVEVCTAHTELFQIVKQINDPLVELCARAERNFSKLVGGGCKQPVGAFAECREGIFSMQTMVGRIGEPVRIVRETISGNSSDSMHLSEQLAQRYESQK